jgi:hypothetical protein
VRPGMRSSKVVGYLVLPHTTGSKRIEDLEEVS